MPSDGSFSGSCGAPRHGRPECRERLWVCWTLDALFNGLPPGGPRLLFNDGTSLSRAFGLISRFSEDIDITVFRDDLGQGVDASELDGLSGKKRRARLDAIRNVCQSYIAGPLSTQFAEIAAAAIPGARFRLEADLDDKEGQTLLFWYPAVTAATGDYIRAAVKIEAGAKSALDPHIATTVTPYVAADLPDLDLSARNVTTVKPERTFWDKVMIPHGLRRPPADAGGGRGRLASRSRPCRRLRNTRQIVFFGNPDLGLDSAAAGTFTLIPDAAMHSAPEQDYAAMSGMIFGDIPPPNAVLASVASLQEALNSASARAAPPGEVSAGRRST